MESKTKVYLVEPHRKPRRKIRRRPLTMREIGIDVEIRGGLFVVPMEANRSTPMVAALCEFSVDLYNTVADLMVQKAVLDAAMEGAIGERLTKLQKTSAEAKELIQDLRGQGHRFRKYIVDVEGGKPVNEPRVWDRQ